MTGPDAQRRLGERIHQLHTVAQDAVQPIRAVYQQRHQAVCTYCYGDASAQC